MKGILRKFNVKALLGKVKLVPGKVAGMSGRTKSRIIKVASGVGVAGILLAGVAPSLNDNTDAVLPPAQTTQDQDATVEADESKDAEDDDLEFSFLSDELNITDIDMESVLGDRIETEVAESAEGMAPVADVGVDENGKPLTKEEIHAAEEKIEGNYFIAPDGTPWVSEEEYNKYIAGQTGNGEEVVQTDTTTTTGESYYVAPDGSFWESETAYQEYINGLNGTQVAPTPDTGTGSQDNEQSVDNGYVAPDGSVWESEADYQEYINSLEGTPAAPAPETGTGSQENNQSSDSSYKAPDGSYWDSEQDYLDYIGQGQNVETDNYYVAPDGSYWDSEAEYNNYINGLSGLQEIGTGEPDNSNDDTNDNSGYVAPDGSYWASEADYQEYINSLNNTNTETNEETVQETNEEDNSNENTSSDYFVAPDGSVWASEADYNEYMKSLSNDAGKTK